MLTNRRRAPAFVHVLLSVAIFATLFLIPHRSGSGDSASSLRWAQVDKGVAAYAYRAGAMMILKDKIASINQNYGALMFDGTRWNAAADPTKSPRSDHMGDMFVDSRGILYAGGIRAEGAKTTTPHSFIFESTDGLNWTPVQPFIDAIGGGIVWNFTEDRYGNVWAGEYTGKTNTTGAHLWRRRPNGVWTNVANWPLPEYHIHNVYYDPYRDALYVAIGDQDRGFLKLSANRINADKISAADFRFILPTFSDGSKVEVTAITSDASYIYAGMDMHSSFGTKTRAISRITDNNRTQTINAVYPLAGCAVWSWADVDDAGNIIFSARGINEWNCTNNYVNQIVASNDHGTSWTVVKDFGSSSTSNGMEYTGLASHYATNWSGLYGGGNGWGGSSLRATVGRVIPKNATFYVDGTNGVDWTNFGISSAAPMKTLNYLEMLDLQPGDTVRFLGSQTYTEPLMAGWSGSAASKITLRGSPTATFAGGQNASAPAVAETFESAKRSWNFTLNEAGGSITADPSVVHGGSQSAKIVRGTAGAVSLQLKNVPKADLAAGDTLFLSYWVYYPADQTAASDTGMLRILDSSNYELSLKLYPESGNILKNEMALSMMAGSIWNIPARRSLTSRTWHKIDIMEYLHATSGSFKLYVDNALWFNVNGIKTVTPGGKLSSIYFYNADHPITYSIDDFKFGKLPLEDRGAIQTNGYSYLDVGGFRIQGTNGVILSSNTTDVDLHDSIFNGLKSDAIINKGGANIHFYYNTVFRSGRYGINASTGATLINNVVYGSALDDLYIGNGASVTGRYNWFMDARKGGPGSFINAGNNTWSGADPQFINAAAGDFHLRPTSPLIDAGTYIAGMATDFDGTARPQGLAPDIGAYESSSTKAYPLTVIRRGLGSGKVTSSPSRIDCGLTCTANFTPGTVVTLSAFASGDSAFAGWSGSGCSGAKKCVVKMDAAKSVTATFILNPVYVPSIVNRASIGGVTWTSAPLEWTAGQPAQ